MFPVKLRFNYLNIKKKSFIDIMCNKAYTNNYINYIKLYANL
jgi:hypothetical protein